VYFWRQNKTKFKSCDANPMSINNTLLYNKPIAPTLNKNICTKRVQDCAKMNSYVGTAPIKLPKHRSFIITYSRCNFLHLYINCITSTVVLFGEKSDWSFYIPCSPEHTVQWDEYFNCIFLGFRKNVLGGDENKILKNTVNVRTKCFMKKYVTMIQW
jgi:hypothetical protein